MIYLGLALTFICAAFMEMYFYRFRGQGHVCLNDTAVRLFFALASTLVVIDIATWHIQGYIIILPILVFVAETIPHSFAQDLGQSGYPSWEWPAWFLEPIHTIYKWDSMGPTKRYWYDFAGMAGVGLATGAYLFLPILYVSTCFQADWITLKATIIAILIHIVGHPISYALGYKTNCHLHILGLEVARKSTDWAELYVGFVYFLSFYTMVYL